MAANYQAQNLGSTSVAFALTGGHYGILMNGTFGGGSAAIQKLSLDGSTYVPVVASFTANGYVNAYLTNGTYRIAPSGTVVSGLYVDISRVPGPVGIPS